LKAQSASGWPHAPESARRLLPPLDVAPLGSSTRPPVSWVGGFQANTNSVLSRSIAREDGETTRQCDPCLAHRRSPAIPQAQRLSLSWPCSGSTRRWRPRTEASAPAGPRTSRRRRRSRPPRTDGVLEPTPDRRRCLASGGCATDRRLRRQGERSQLADAWEGHPTAAGRHGPRHASHVCVDRSDPHHHRAGPAHGGRFIHFE
jgi:hypothetical protein